MHPILKPNRREANRLPILQETQVRLFVRYHLFRLVRKYPRPSAALLAATTVVTNELSIVGIVFSLFFIKFLNLFVGKTGFAALKHPYNCHFPPLVAPYGSDSV